jgi:uncharacterized DUF497 family protein
MDLEFEWDDEKAKENKRKHGISFELAKLVFNDEHRVEFYDDENSANEDRYDVIGKVSDILFVVYTERKDKIRIISARLATKIERRVYNDYNNNIISE